ncbi:hypothetical protein C2W64_01431 [Brevibacillus laterosporus]|nr:hypothetical protein C2W64_01431 [Brevibacillus laterosporus]
MESNISQICAFLRKFETKDIMILDKMTCHVIRKGGYVADLG